MIVNQEKMSGVKLNQSSIFDLEKLWMESPDKNNLHKLLSVYQNIIAGETRILLKETYDYIMLLTYIIVIIIKDANFKTLIRCIYIKVHLNESYNLFFT